MSAFVFKIYDVDYDTRKNKKGKTLFIVRRFVATKVQKMFVAIDFLF